MGKLVVLEAEELRELVRDVVAEALEGRPAVVQQSAPALLDRSTLAERLGVSTAALDRLRNEKDFPELRIGDVPRFELEHVLAWLRERGKTPGLRAVG